MSTILEKSNLTYQNLPYIRPYDSSRLCYHGILGYCSGHDKGNCHSYLPTKEEVATPGFAEELVAKLQPGVNEIMKNGLPALPGKRKRKFG